MKAPEWSVYKRNVQYGNSKQRRATLRYCPVCKEVTDQVSFKLLQETDQVTALYPVCENITFLEYHGKTVTLTLAIT
jgi:hypothetical protein